MMTSTEKTDDSLEEPQRKSPRQWKAITDASEEEADPYRRLGKEAYEEYTYSKAQSKSFGFKRAQNQHFPIFWADIQTVKPTCYSQLPRPLVTRYYQNAADQVGRIMALLAERLAKRLIEKADFDAAMSRITDDFLVTGRGIGRIYYEAKIPKADKIYLTPETMPPEGVEILSDKGGEYYEEIPEPEEEAIKVEWVPFDQHGSTPGAKAWCESWFQYQDKYYDRDEFIKRFGEDKAKLVSFSYSAKREASEEVEAEQQEDDNQSEKFAKVREIWDSKNKEVLWLSCDYLEDFLDVQPDIYDLADFYPYPRAMEGNKGKDSNFPIPEYVQYRQSIHVLDFLQDRIWRLIKALRARGVYDAGQTELRRLASETSEADLVPVENFMALAEKGGLDEVIKYLDTSKLATALLQAYEAFDRQKEYVREITGYSDVMRGVVQASESATATATKDKFVTSRLSVKRMEVQRFARDLIEKMLDLALAKFSNKSIIEMTGAMDLDENDKILAIDAIAKLRSDRLRGFKIEIETDSTISIDREIEREGRFQLFQNLTEFFSTVAQIRDAAPEALLAMKESALHALATVRDGQSIEGAVKDSFDAMVEAANEEPEELPSDPKLEADMAKIQADMQIKEQEMQVKLMELELEKEKIALEREKLMVEQAVNAQKTEVEMIKAQLAEMKLKLDLTESMKPEPMDMAPMIQQPEPKAPPSPPMEIHIHNGKEGGKKVGRWVGNEFIVESVEEGQPVLNGL